MGGDVSNIHTYSCGPFPETLSEPPRYSDDDILIAKGLNKYFNPSVFVNKDSKHNRVVPLLMSDLKNMEQGKPQQGPNHNEEINTYDHLNAFSHFVLIINICDILL